MSDKKAPRLGDGNVVITLVDSSGYPKEETLVPSYNAARTLSAQYGGLLRALDQVAAGNIEAVVAIITLGLGYGGARDTPPKDLAERIWRSGFSDDTGGIGERCAFYVRVLLSGGQTPARAPSDEEDAPQPDPT